MTPTAYEESPRFAGASLKPPAKGIIALRTRRIPPAFCGGLIEASASASCRPHRRKNPPRVLRGASLKRCCAAAGAGCALRRIPPRFAGASLKQEEPPVERQPHVGIPPRFAGASLKLHDHAVGVAALLGGIPPAFCGGLIEAATASASFSGSTLESPPRFAGASLKQSTMQAGGRLVLESSRVLRGPH